MEYFEKHKIQSIPVDQAVGTILRHDITQIVPDIFKGPRFRKGHLITEEDVEVLKDLGKEHIFVACLNGEIHENDAARRIAKAAAGPGLSLSDPKEGKINFTATRKGLLKVNVEALLDLNSIPDMVFATLHNNRVVQKGEELAGTRVVPLSIDENRIIEAEAVCHGQGPILQVVPFQAMDVSIVVTGSEVFSGRIRDGFGPVVTDKFQELDCRILGKELVSDDQALTTAAIQRALDNGADLVAVTGGMSVDPDDRTPAAIKAVGGEVIFYGAPVLPGAMFMLARVGKATVLGLPGCVMYHRTSIFDLLVPRILAGEELTRRDVVALGHGGFCASCKSCRFPNCHFGK